MCECEAVHRVLFNAALDANAAEVERSRPSYLYRPTLTIDGDQWCALYGANIQDGVAGFGASPDAAYRAFDKAWYEAIPNVTTGPKGDG